MQFFRNISSNYVKAGIDALVLVLLTPYVVNQLGSPLYAVWIIIWTLGYYLDFLDLGIADAQVQRHSVLVSRGATTELGRLHGTVLTLFMGAGAVAVLISLLLVALPTAEVFDVPEHARQAYYLILPLIGISTLFSFSELAFNGLFEGYQRYDVMNKIDIVLTVIEAVAMAAVLHLGYGLLGLAIVNVAMDGVGMGVKILTARKLFPAHALPKLAFPKLGFDKDSWRAIRGFSLWNSLNDLMTEGTAQLDKLLIPVLLGSALLTPYALVVMLAAAIMAIAEPITETFFPLASRRHGSKDAVALGVLLKRGTKLVTIVTLPTLVVILCFGNTLLDVWIGAEHTNISAAVLWLTALSFFFSTYLWTSLSVLTGSGRVRMLFWASLLEVALTLALILLLAPRFGLPGLAFASLVTNVLIGARFFVRAACGLTGTAYWPFVGQTLLLPFAAVLPGLALGWWLMRQVQPDGLLDTGLCVLATGLASLVCVLFTQTSRWEFLRYRVTLRRLLTSQSSA